MEKKPDWLKVTIAPSAERAEVLRILKGLSLNTVCASALCPNCSECFGRKTATFMILGSVCTRLCAFCNVDKGIPSAIDDGEPQRIAAAVEELGLTHVVVTSVTRDDLRDGGASQFARVVECVRESKPGTTIEVLVPDFRGSEESLADVVRAKPDILNHNLETVRRLYPEVRPGAVYERSLDVIRNARRIDPGIVTKSGIMLGLGETGEEVRCAMSDLRQAGCSMLTIGQYLAPSKKHHPVVEFVHPDRFERLKREGLAMGFGFVASGPLVRSSYHAGDDFAAMKGGRE